MIWKQTHKHHHRTNNGQWTKIGGKEKNKYEEVNKVK